MEDQLTGSQGRWKLALEYSKLGMWDWNILTGDNYWSDRFFELLGYQPGELIPSFDTWASLLPPNERVEVLERLRHHLEQRAPYDLEYRLKTKSGPYRWFHAKGLAVWDASDKAIRMIGTVSDINERKQRDLLLHAAIEAAPSGLLVVAHDSTLMLVNSHAETLFGYRREELLGQPVEMLLPERFRTRHLEHRIIFSGNPTTRAMGMGRDLYGQRKDGTEFPVEIGLSPINTPDGLQVVATIIDITERKRTEATLHSSRERFELAVRGTNDGIWDWNVLTGNNYWSDRFFELLGYQPGELAPSFNTWASLLHPDDRVQMLEGLRHHLEQRAPYDLEYRLKTKNGPYRWFHAKGLAVWDAADRPIRMAGSISDVTERRLAQEALLQSERLLRDALNERERIVLNLHDGAIQSLFGLGLMMAEMKSLVDDDPKATIVHIHGMRNILNAVIRNLREDIIGGKLDPTYEGDVEKALTNLIAEVKDVQAVMSWALQIDHHAVGKITKHKQHHLLYLVREAVNNILRHARATRGTITVAARNGGVRVTIEDDGVGFDDRSINRTGQGLRNMEIRAEKLSAKITVNSKPSHGTRIVLDLPAKEG